jgi:DNA-binding response OmpR family regulator
MTPLAKKKILVVDDDNDILEVLTEALIFEGYEVKGLPQTDNIFPEIIQYQPDLVILDYLLNGVNGGELCHQIKINRHTTKLPVIIMSAHPRVLQSLGNYGCNQFIAKPFDLTHIISSIQQLLESPLTTEAHA